MMSLMKAVSAEVGAEPDLLSGKRPRAVFPRLIYNACSTWYWWLGMPLLFRC